MSEIQLQKKEYRKKALERRNLLSKQELSDKSQQIHSKIIDLSEYRNASVLLFYASYLSEVDTFLLMKKALQDKKRCFFPKVNGREMNFYEVRQINDLVPGFHGILEPLPDNAFQWNESLIENTLMIVPGTVFDRNRNRIGYGGGYYDRFLKKYPVHNVALFFDCQEVEQIPSEPFDIKPKQIITETRWIKE